uniref:MADS-box domain-containing protein n=1 Tax=Glycine max TaxID=3847 RepID=A0A0R0EV26_SOYBN
MGRARITLKHISNERSRKTVSKQRKKGLIEKVSKFSTMFGDEACLIVYDDENGDVGPVTWPQHPTLIHAIIQKYYEIQSKNERPQETFVIQDFFANRKKMVEADISKVQKQIASIKYPTWDQSIRNIKEEKLRGLIAHVDSKIRGYDHRINMLKNKHQSEAKFSFVQNMAQASGFSNHPSQILLNDDNRRVNFTNSMDQFDGACNYGINNMMRNMQQGDACFSFVPNMAQESSNATSSHVSHPSQLNCLQNISQSQPVLEALKPLSDKNEIVDSSNQVDANQFVDLENWFDGPIDW